MFWLPGSFSSGLKPDDFAVTMASAYMGNPFNQTYSVHPTFFGDAYANFGFFGIFLGVVWAVVFNCLDRWIANIDSRAKPYVVSALAYAFVLIGRGSVYNGTVIGIVSIALIFAAFFILERKRKAKTVLGQD